MYFVPRGGGGGLSIFTDRDQRSILGFEFRKSVFFLLLPTAAVFFGLLDKCCIFKCFIFLTVFLGSFSFTWYISNHRTPLLSYRA